MPQQVPQVLLAFVALLILVGVILFSQWRIRRMAVRHGELHKAVMPLFPWPFVLTHKWRASPEFRREYAPFIRRTLIATCALVGLFVALLLAAN